MARGVDGREIFGDDADRLMFLSELDAASRKDGLTIIAYCLMGNHFHLAVKVSRATIGHGMQRVLGTYARSFNGKYEREGHLFQGRFLSKLCLDDAYYIGMIRYIHENPVRAGLVKHPAEWPWSSYRKMQSEGCDPMLLQRGDSNFEPWPAGTELLRTESPTILLPIDEIGAQFADREGLALPMLKSRTKRRSITAARRRFIAYAASEGHLQSTIAKWLTLPSSSVSRALRIAQKTTSDTRIS